MMIADLSTIDKQAILSELFVWLCWWRDALCVHFDDDSINVDRNLGCTIIDTEHILERKGGAGIFKHLRTEHVLRL